MLFGWEWRLGPVVISVHLILESLAYALGFWLYNRARREQGDVLPVSQRNSVIVAAILGAAGGSKLLAILTELPALGDRPFPEIYLLSGKTIAGGILGGTLVVEWTKARLGITTRTGDLFAIPLALGMALGRIGCFLDGLRDRTYGVATSLPWGVDFGDGIRRHPVQLYEVAFLLALAAVLSRLPHRTGGLYRAFLIAYLAWRVAIDFLKPEPAIAGLSAIQWACAAALFLYAPSTRRLLTLSEEPLHG